MQQSEVNSSEQPAKFDYVLILGYSFLAVSAFIFALCEWVGAKDDMFIVFWLHYVISIVYTGILVGERNYGIIRSWRKENLGKTAIALNLYLLSAYALNREMTVFENSVDWLCVLIVCSSITTLAFQFYERVPRFFRIALCFFLGSSVLFYLYLAIFVAQYYLMGAIGILAIGMGLHIFVPACFVLLCIFLLKANHIGRRGYYAFALGAFTAISATTVFTLIWTERISKIERLSNQSVMFDQPDLPLWISTAQEIENDWISHRLLKSDLVYSVSTERFFRNWDLMPNRVSWSESRRHDPLVFVASIFAKCSLSADDRVKILKALSNGRHQANERLWSGDNLTTSYVVSDVDIYPKLHLAFTEKYLNIRNNAEKQRWDGNSEEAIYTFYLPEGSVITSLSLWIDGKEEKGILTSKQKATQAYTAIVGRERRDPSVVHWQEGNTVTVRVFPCTTNEERKFKIGITSPLPERDGKVFYRNIVFDGPDAGHAKETRRIRFIGDAGDVQLPGDFEEQGNGDFISEGDYDPDFELALTSQPVLLNHFTFDGYTYSVEKYRQEKQAFKCNSIFLDINNSWTGRDIDEAKALLNGFKLFISTSDQFNELTDRNWDKLTLKARKRSFSVFPFYKITDPAHSLVITKGVVMSPHLSDFSESNFAINVNSYFAEGRKVKVYNLTGGSSTYISSLRELRGLEFAVGTIDDLAKLLSENSFVKYEESNERIILHDAQLVITKTRSEQPPKENNAPDHLARLFAYNDIMRKVGVSYLMRDFVHQELVDEAAAAYVVSPVSSLIVLETKNDYERFGIEDTNNSLKNAVKQSSGAVPEPHEWALIILFLLLIVYTRYRSSINRMITR